MLRWTKVNLLMLLFRYLPELCRCNMCWKDERTLLIGWADRVKVYLYFFSFLCMCSLQKVYLYVFSFLCIRSSQKFVCITPPAFQMGILQNFIFLHISMGGGMMFSATFNNISVISWWKVFWWRKYEYPEKSTDLP
jgi:hypothetical protein